MSTDLGLGEFLDVRDRLLAIAHHVAGGIAEADDIVQDAWMRWQRTDRSVVVDPSAFLCRTTARLSVSAIRSARRRPAIPAGSWLERVEGPDADPARTAEQADDLRSVVRLLTDVLLPRERVIYLLREAFGWPYHQIGSALGLSETNARQLARRARLRLSVSERTRAPAAPGAHLVLLSAFLRASRTGDAAALVALASA
ncbi:sigma-70 family RNA polymerase sigma factor, partial [Cryptosporangium arvum]|uniref:sigma-70 family RNA polymerase sigma factor n=1 Tax=Cryptosporangium arvum TaxID=80871 RepID=UPI0004B18E63